MGNNIWYFIHHVSQAPASGAHTRLLSLQASNEIKNVNATEIKGYVLNKFEFAPYGPEDDEIQIMAEVTEGSLNDCKQI